MNNLFNKWNKLITIELTKKGVDNLNIEKASNKWWNIINEKYNEKQRFYHNTTHINELLNLEEQFKSKLKRSDIVQYSIFFHDIIYDPTKHDNEEESANLFNQFSDDIQLPIDTSKTVTNYILATKNHTKINSDDEKDTDLLYFLDMDLSILGTDSLVYNQYSDSIRKEYSHIPDDIYKKGRSKILQSFVDAGYQSLFKTNEFKEKYGKKAIENLKFEINKLSLP